MCRRRRRGAEAFSVRRAKGTRGDTGTAAWIDEKRATDTRGVPRRVGAAPHSGDEILGGGALLGTAAAAAAPAATASACRRHITVVHARCAPRVLTRYYSIRAQSWATR